MVRTFVLAIFVAGGAWAQSLPVYEGPVPVDLGGRVLALPIAVTAEAAGEGRLRVRIEAVLEGVLPVAAEELKREIDGVPQSCEDRLSLGDVTVAATEGRIAVSVGFRYARWLCEAVLGAKVETELFTETATVHAKVEPHVKDGRLQLRLAAFRVSELGELAKALNAEAWMRGELEAAIAALNARPGFAQPPAPVWDEGYRYDSVGIADSDGPVLRVGIAGPDSALALLRIKAAFESR